jgi:dTMP kinase
MSLFISIEGPDGSGKSTQARLLADALRTRGLPVLSTREPGGTPVGEAIRDIVLHPREMPATPTTIALLYATSRSELVRTVIRPALESGTSVVADRYSDSTIAYQSYGLGVPLEVTRCLAAIATDGLKPDVTVYVDITPERGLERLAGRRGENWLDRESVAFHARVRDGYLQMMEEDPGRWLRVDGDAPPEAVHSAILRALEPILESERNAV